MLLKREPLTVDGASGKSKDGTGGDSMVSYEAITAFTTVGLLIVAIIALFVNRKK